MRLAVIALAALGLAAVDNAHAYKPGKVSSGGSSSAKSQPGFCTEQEDCKVAGYECVALQTTRAGAADVKQCLPKKEDTDVCSGQFPGLCPSFSSWTEPYKLISSVCAYKPAKKCAKDPNGPSVKGEVVCVPGAKDADGDELSVIYGCVDVDVDERKLGFTDKEDAGKLAKKLDTANTVIEACLDANSTSQLLCSGHGTCLAKSAASLEYECRCNVGYSGQYCEEKDSNKCALPGQCSAGECNLDKQVCECPAGTTGNQCGDCDASSSSACNDNGKCVNKKCTCDSGFLGDHCDQQSQPKSSKTSTSDSPTSSSSESTNSTTESRAGALATPTYLTGVVTVALVVASGAFAL